MRVFRDTACVSILAVAIMATASLVVAGPTAAPSSASGSRVSSSPETDAIICTANQASFQRLEEVRQALQKAFRDARRQEQLKRFIDESLSLAEKFQQVTDLATNPGGSEARLKALFRQHVLNEDVVCRELERMMTEYCSYLDQQDQALLMKLKIDRAVARTTLSRSVIDPAAFKRPIMAVVSSTVTSVQNDMVRSIAAFAASEAIGAGVKRAARDIGVMPGEEGSVLDFFTGIMIDIGVGMAVDAVTDPSPKMIADLEARLVNAEQAILDGTPTAPGFITKLQRLTEERAELRRKLVSVSASK